MREFPKTEQETEKAGWPCWSCEYSSNNIKNISKKSKFPKECRVCIKEKSYSKPSQYKIYMQKPLEKKDK